MASAREIVKRRKSVRNILKITGTMEMIARARFKKAHDRAVGSRPYTENIARLVSTLAGGVGEASHPLLAENRDCNRAVVLVLTSNRGLCGGYNGNIIRMSVRKLEQMRKRKQEIELRVSGKKGIQYFKFAGGSSVYNYTQFDDKTTYAEVEKLADEFISLYEAQEINGVHVVYTRFVSSAKFYPEVQQLLPVVSLEADPAEVAARVNIEEYFFSPNAEEILSELIPATVRARLFQCFSDAIVSEQVSRMRAMKSATDNAEQMIQALTRQYNRARQSQITSELLDIMGGVEAIK